MMPGDDVYGDEITSGVFPDDDELFPGDELNQIWDESDESADQSIGQD